MIKEYLNYLKQRVSHNFTQYIVVGIGLVLLVVRNLMHMQTQDEVIAPFQFTAEQIAQTELYGQQQLKIYFIMSAIMIILIAIIKYINNAQEQKIAQQQNELKEKQKIN